MREIDKAKISQILELLRGLKFYEWKSIERAVDYEFSYMVATEQHKEAEQAAAGR